VISSIRAYPRISPDGKEKDNSDKERELNQIGLIFSINLLSLSSVLGPLLWSKPSYGFSPFRYQRKCGNVAESDESRKREEGVREHLAALCNEFSIEGSFMKKQVNTKVRIIDSWVNPFPDNEAVKPGRTATLQAHVK